MTGAYDISGLALNDDTYEVQQALVRNKYKAMDARGNVVLRGKQKMFKLKEQFPFVGPNDQEVFRVKAGGIIDVAGNYTLTDSQTDEPLVVLDNDYSLFRDVWKIRDAGNEQKLAEITSRGALVTLARNSLPFAGWIPHKYEITDPEGNHVGNIDGQLSLKDEYRITIDDASSVPKEAVIAAAMVIDAIQGN